MSPSLDYRRNWNREGNKKCIKIFTFAEIESNRKINVLLSAAVTLTKKSMIWQFTCVSNVNNGWSGIEFNLFEVHATELISCTLQWVLLSVGKKRKNGKKLAAVCGIKSKILSLFIFTSRWTWENAKMFVKRLRWSSDK